MSRKTSSSAPSLSYRRACSTGSPASIRSTKRIPLTTRPRSTSRQGRILFASIFLAARCGDRFSQGESAFIQRLADNHRSHAIRFEVAQLLDILERSDAAGRGDRYAGFARKVASELEVRALEPPIASAVGVDYSSDAEGHNVTGKVEGVNRGGRRPASSRDFASPCVDADDDRLAEFRNRVAEYSGLLDRQRPDDNKACAYVSNEHPNVGDRSNSAA